MIEIKVKAGESIEKALKRFKRKFDRTKLLKNIREKSFFAKPSVIKRKQKIKAVYKQKLQNMGDI